MKVTQKDQILFFFSTKGYKNKKGELMEYQPKDISEEFPTFAKSSVRRVLQELLKDGKLIRETRGHYNFNDEEEEPPEEPPTIYQKILKIGASSGGKFRKIYAVTYEFDDQNRESELLEAIELDFKTFVSINYDYRDLTDFKGVFIKKKDDIEDFGYASVEWEDSVRIDQFYPEIETGEE